MYLLMLRHGKIDPSDKKSLEKGNPHADRQWLTDELPKVAAILKEIHFDAIYSGNLNRMLEMRDELIFLGVSSLFHTTNPALNASVTYHEGKMYPEGVMEPMKAHMPEMLEFCRELAKRHSREATILCVTSGARMGPVRALSLGYWPKDEETMMAWVLKDANAKLGEIWVFEYDPILYDNSIREIRIDQLKIVNIE